MRDPDSIKAARRRWYACNQERAKASVVARKHERIARLRRYRSERGCTECGEHHPAVLDFHHVNPLLDSDPDSRVYNLVWRKGWGWDRVAEHIRHECIVLCANCHRKLHWRDNATEPGTPPDPAGRLIAGLTRTS